MVGPIDSAAPQVWAEQAVVHRTHMQVFGFLFDPGARERCRAPPTARRPDSEMAAYSDGSCDVWLSQAYGKENSFLLQGARAPARPTPAPL